MVIVLGTIDVDPAERELFLQGFQPQIEASRGDAGCVSFTVSADSSDPGRVHFTELWATREDLARHGAANERRNLPAGPVARLAASFLVYESGDPTPL